MDISNEKLILLTNDDGFYSPGIQAVRLTLQKIARVVVVAPDRERSGVSHSLTIVEPLRFEQPTNSAACEDCFTLSGTPADCVKVGLSKLLPRKPDLIVSGINRGANTGINVNYSGTVAAASEGTLAGIPSIALSRSSFDPTTFESAAQVAAQIAEQVIHQGLPEGILLNVNIPLTLNGDKPQIVITHLSGSHWQDHFIERKDPRNLLYFWLDGIRLEHSHDPEADTDVLRDGRISITPLRVDRTAHEHLDYFRTWSWMNE